MRRTFLAGPLLLAAVAVVSIARAGSPPDGPPPDRATPKDAVRAFVAALLEGDDATLGQLTLDDPDHRRAAVALGRFSHALARAEAASLRRFQSSLASDGNPKVTLALPDLNAVNYAKVESDGTFATVRVDGVPEPYRVRRVGDVWQIDMTAAKVATPEALRAMADLADRAAPLMADFADEIEQGQIETVGAARMVFLFAMLDAVAPTTAPATSPAAGPATSPAAAPAASPASAADPSPTK